MGIEAVDDVKVLCILRGLGRKIRRRTAADHEYIDLILIAEDMIDGIDLDTSGMNLHTRRIATCKYRYELLIRVPLDGSLDAAGQVSITK